jgi:hypothetical protein
MIYPVCNDFSRAGKYILLFSKFPALETGEKDRVYHDSSMHPCPILKYRAKSCKIEMFDTVFSKMQNREIYQNCL